MLHSLKTTRLFKAITIDFQMEPNGFKNCALVDFVLKKGYRAFSFISILLSCHEIRCVDLCFSCFS